MWTTKRRSRNEHHKRLAEICNRTQQSLQTFASFYLLSKMLWNGGIILLVQFSKYLESLSMIRSGIRYIWHKQFGLVFIETQCIFEIRSFHFSMIVFLHTKVWLLFIKMCVHLLVHFYCYQIINVLTWLHFPLNSATQFTSIGLLTYGKQWHWLKWVEGRRRGILPILPCPEFCLTSETVLICWHEFWCVLGEIDENDIVRKGVLC